MRLLPLALLLACTGKPVTGTLPEGIFGSPDLGLRVDATGNATFERSCWSGDLGAISAADGVLTADFEWNRTGGDPEGIGTEPGTPATLDATATTTAISGTLTSDGETLDIDLHFGEEPTYFECP